eukprot:403338923
MESIKVTELQKGSLTALVQAKLKNHFTVIFKPIIPKKKGKQGYRVKKHSLSLKHSSLPKKTEDNEEIPQKLNDSSLSLEAAQISNLEHLTISKDEKTGEEKYVVKSLSKSTLSKLTPQVYSYTRTKGNKCKKEGLQADRQLWKNDEFNHLRTQSLLQFQRKRMAYILKRKKQNVFSKIQKHRETLETVIIQIEGALKAISFEGKSKCSKDTLDLNQQEGEKNVAIYIDSNNKKIYYEVQKYFRQLKSLWEFIHTDSTPRLPKNLKRVRVCQLSKNLYTKTELKSLGKYVPAFIKSPQLTDQNLQAYILQGLSLQEALSIKKCIELELEAHKRVNSYQTFNDKNLEKQNCKKERIEKKSKLESLQIQFKNDELTNTLKDECIIDLEDIIKSPTQIQESEEASPIFFTPQKKLDRQSNMRKMSEKLCKSEQKLIVSKSSYPEQMMVMKRHESQTQKMDMSLLDQNPCQSPRKQYCLQSDVEIGISDYETNASSCFESPYKSYHQHLSHFSDSQKIPSINLEQSLTPISDQINHIIVDQISFGIEDFFDDMNKSQKQGDHLWLNCKENKDEHMIINKLFGFQQLDKQPYEEISFMSPSITENELLSSGPCRKLQFITDFNPQELELVDDKKNFDYQNIFFYSLGN